MTSSTICVRSVPGAGCVLAITPNWIITMLLSLRARLVEQAPGLALPPVGVVAQADGGSQRYRPPDAQGRLEPILQDRDKLSPPGDAVLPLNLNRHVLAYIEPGRLPFHDAQPLAGGSVVRCHRPHTGHWEYVRATDLDHVVAAPQEVIHLPRIAATCAALAAIAHDADVIAQVVADQRRGVAGQAGGHEVSPCARGQDGIGVHVGPPPDENILPPMVPLPRPALQGRQPP